MAKVRKYGKGYMIDYYDPQGKRVRLCYKKRKDAEGELAKRVSLISERRYLDFRKECVTPFGEILDLYHENFKRQSAFVGKRHYLENFRSHFGAETLIANIKYADLESYRNKLAEKEIRPGKPRTTAAVNREMSCLHHIFRKGVEWGMLEKSPFEGKASLLRKENNARMRFLNEDEIRRLLAMAAPHLQNIILVGIYTGMRKGELLGLRWSQIRGGYIYLQKTKTDEGRQIPVNSSLAVLLERIRKGQGPGSVFVFSRVPAKQKTKGSLTVIEPAGDPIRGVKKAWATACRKAGLEDVTIHTLRHTAASLLVQRGASLKTVQEFLGHKSLGMTMRYSHLAASHRRDAAELLADLTGWAKNGQSAGTGRESSTANR